MTDPTTLARDRWELFALGRSLAEALRAKIDAARAAGRMDDGAYAAAMARHGRLEAILRRILADLGDASGAEASRG